MTLKTFFIIITGFHSTLRTSFSNTWLCVCTLRGEYEVCKNKQHGEFVVSGNKHPETHFNCWTKASVRIHVRVKYECYIFVFNVTVRIAWPVHLLILTSHAAPIWPYWSRICCLVLGDMDVHRGGVSTVSLSGGQGQCVQSKIYPNSVWVRLC